MLRSEAAAATPLNAAVVVKVVELLEATVITFDRNPDAYRHWRVAVDGRIATLTLDVDEDARIVSYPGSSLIELLRPRPSSQPAAASLPEAVGALLGRSVAELLSHAQQSVTGTTALLLGDYRF